VVKSISGVRTVRFKNEFVRNITIKLGYANAKIYHCPTAPRLGSYISCGSNKEDKFESEHGTMHLKRHVSFVDCPGHDILMATMLNGAAVMDAALLLIGKARNRLLQFRHCHRIRRCCIAMVTATVAPGAHLSLVCACASSCWGRSAPRSVGSPLAQVVCHPIDILVSALFSSLP
jgi:hypothetical protein